MSDTRHIEERQTTTPIMGSILSFFSDGKKRTRYQASKALNLTERQFRANVEKLNELGYPIISEGFGFFLATSVEQIKKAKVRLEATRDSLDKRVRDHDKMEAEFARLQEGIKQLTFF
jgi:hypothetical protein